MPAFAAGGSPRHSSLTALIKTLIKSPLQLLPGYALMPTMLQASLTAANGIPSAQRATSVAPGSTVTLLRNIEAIENTPDMSGCSASYVPSELHVNCAPAESN